MTTQLYRVISKRFTYLPLSVELLKSTGCISFRPVVPYSNDANDYEARRQEGVESRTVEFSRNRSRDISGEAIDMRDGQEMSHMHQSSVDDHVASYDSQGTISLNSCMQTNVPEPYSTHGKKAPTHLNMPGGHVGQNQKYLSDDRIKAQSTFKSNGDLSYFSNRATSVKNNLSFLLTRNYSTCLMNYNTIPNANKNSCFRMCSQQAPESKPLTRKEKLKLAVKDYGSTVVVFHVTISLMSLGGFYLAVSSGLDVVCLLQKVGLANHVDSLVEGASTFVIAYAIHKVFAPARMAITLAAVPIIVTYLRKRGILKRKV